VSGLRRRAFVSGAAGLGSVAVAMAVLRGREVRSSVSQRARVRIGVLGGSTYASTAPGFEMFVQVLRDLGYVEGQNLAIEWRFTGGAVGAEAEESFFQQAVELAHMPVDLLVPNSTQSTRAAMKATTTIPIVMVSPVAPVESGLVTSLTHPGGNVTGVAGSRPGLAEKRLELLSHVIAGTQRIGVLWNPTEPGSNGDWLEVTQAASRLGLTLTGFEAGHAEELERILQALAEGHYDGLVVLQHPLFTANRQQIVASLVRSRLPTVTFSATWVELGVLMAYGPNGPASYRIAAMLVDKILSGRSPSALPVELPSSFDLHVNARAAQALGLVIPPDVAAQVTKWVD
jgi:putative ABC transport system substrate-binding protein